MTAVDTIARYGDMLHEASHGIGCDCRIQVRRQFRRYVEAVMAWLAADGRLTRENPPDPRPVVTVLCGSTRFRDTFHEVNHRLTLAGHIVLAPGVFGHADATPPAEQVKAGLDALHLAKIDLADEVLVVDPGGYIGTSTATEINYAQRCGKPVRFLSGHWI